MLGGGPAGAAAAITLARAGRSVVVIEKSHYEQPRIGETLPPAARPLLARLAVWEPFLAAGHLPSPGVLSVWGDDELYENHFIFNPYGQGWHLDRQRFDRMLARAARHAGASAYCGAQVTFVPAARWTGAGRSRSQSTAAPASQSSPPRAVRDRRDRTRGGIGAPARAKRLNADRLVGLADVLAPRVKPAPKTTVRRLHAG